MLKQRILTASVLIALFLGLLFYLSPAQFCILMSVVGLWAAWEWTTLIAIQGKLARLLYVVAMFLIFFKVLFMPIIWVLSVSLLWWVFATTLVCAYPQWRQWYGSWLTRLGMGVCVLTPCWAALNYLRSQTNGLFLLLFLFGLVWGADSTAYFVGRKWGAHKLAPSVSPQKSIQGAVGACVFAVLFTGCVLLMTHAPVSAWAAMFVLGFITTLFSIVGDLFESMLKREANLKDINQWLPGHGGLLDRIDSLTAAAPMFALGIWLL